MDAIVRIYTDKRITRQINQKDIRLRKEYKKRRNEDGGVG